MLSQTMNRKYFKWLYDHIGVFQKNIMLCLMLSILAVMFSLLFVESTKIFIEGVEKGEIYSFLLLLTLLVTIKGCHIFCAEIQVYLRNKTVALINNTLSLRFFRELLSASPFHAEQLHSGDALNRLTTDVSEVANCSTETILGLIYAFLQLSATCVYLLLIEPVLTAVILFIMPMAIAIEQAYAKKLLSVSREIRTRDSKVNQFMQEHLQHHELIVTLEKTSFIWERLKTLQSILYEKIITRIKLCVLTNSLTDIAIEISYIVIFIWGIFGIQNNSFSYAELVVFLQLAEQIQTPFIQFKFHYPALIASAASIERLIEIENMPKEDAASSHKFSVPAGVEFSDVYFRYTEDSRWIYRGFSHNFAPNSITAVVGETGAGKSTLLRLLLAVLSPVSGSITFYGTENGTLRHYPASPSTRGNCVYVPQGNSLISGTIRYNLLLGKTDATEEEMHKALYAAAAEFVMKDFPDGLDTLVGESGIGISEGQAQRIAIARSLLCSGNVILMDEPTSALDAETERIFLMRLTEQLNNKTIIVVTHKKEICKYVSDVITIKLLRE